MVASIKQPQHDDLALLDQVVLERAGGKNRQYFENFHVEWRQRVELYLNSAGDPSKIARSTIVDAVDKKKFINLYENAKKDHCQYSVLKSLRKNKLMYCPSCGEDGAPETLDHYLPKDEFPEYAVLTKNLTPMCGRCQREKLAKFVDEKNNRQFLHPYFDGINSPVLKVDIVPPYDFGTTFRVYVSPDADDNIRPIVSRHIKELAIPTRLLDYCIEKYQHLLRLVADDPPPRNEVVGFLKLFLKMEEKKAHNAWGALFYRSVLANPSLIEYLRIGILPKNL